jgi:hypothetical protein
MAGIIPPAEQQLAPSQNELLLDYLKASRNEVGVNADMGVLSKYVREKVFYVVIHDLKNPSDDVFRTGGPLCNSFIRCFCVPANRKSLVNAHIVAAKERDLKEYLQFLWKKGITERGTNNIRKVFSNEKSSVYSAIRDAFLRKWDYEISACVIIFQY